ncbi:hypothetical protein TNCV_4519761 [Trichonephila clavipes]|nr:hypothetical protein TNCV_4519761 [Trichonephila clavipes]
MNSLTNLATVWTLSSKTMAVTCITDKIVFNGVVNDEPGLTNGEMSFFLDESRFCLQHQEPRSLVRIDGTWGSARYISGVLPHVALFVIRVMRNLTF